MTQTSMTYGTMPSRGEFDAAFDRECPNGKYNIRLGSSDSRAMDGFNLGDGEWSATELYDACAEINASAGDTITVSNDDEFENVFHVFYGTDRPFVEIGPDVSELIEWANKFSGDIVSESRAIECLNYASAYGQTGTDWTRFDAAMGLVSSVMETLGFEWV